jgi:hypothetical protein
MIHPMPSPRVALAALAAVAALAGAAPARVARAQARPPRRTSTRWS